MVWFAVDIGFTSVVIYSAYKREVWGSMVRKLDMGVEIGVVLLKGAGRMWPDKRKMLIAYQSSLVLQVPISRRSLILSVWRGDTKGWSLEV